jgi:hypothetical protein
MEEIEVEFVGLIAEKARLVLLVLILRQEFRDNLEKLEGFKRIDQYLEEKNFRTVSEFRKEVEKLCATSNFLKCLLAREMGRSEGVDQLEREHILFLRSR